MSKDNVDDVSFSFENQSKESKMKHLKSTIAGHKSRVTYFKNKVNNNELTSIGELESALSRLRLTYEKFDSAQSKLEYYDNSFFGKRDTFEDEFGFVESTILDLIRELNNETKLANVPSKDDLSSDNLHTSVSLKLPEIQLPKFDGSELGWLDFRGIYLDLIHSNNNLSNIAKYHYLVSCIRDGKAYKFVQSLSISNENYPVAWKNLTDHYNNEFIIKKSHMKRLYDIKKPVENSSSSLQSFLDTVVKHYNALKALKVPVDAWDLFLIHHLCDRLDDSSKIEIITKSPVMDILTFDKFVEILKLRCKILDAKRSSNLNASNTDFTNKSSSNTNRSNKFSSHTDRFGKPTGVMVAQGLTCVFCKGNHSLDYCSQFRDHKISPQDRYNIIKKYNLCTNCLIDNHRTMECSKPCCSFCSLKHHSLLHFGRSNQNNSSNNYQSSQKSSSSDQSSNNCQSTSQKSSTSGIPYRDSSSLQKSSENSGKNLQNFSSSTKSEKSSKQFQILVATAVVWIRNSSGDRIQCRALLDSGSQANFVTQNMIQLLNLKPESTHVNILGINGTVSTITKKAKLFVESRTSDFATSLDCLVKPKISGLLPSYPVNIDRNLIPHHVELADPWFFKPDTIDLLIGAEIFAEIMVNEKIDIIREIPFHNSVFGYVVMGKVPENPDVITHQSSTIVTSLCSFEQLNETLERFWKIESIENPHKMSIEEKLCESQYLKSVVRTETGRYSVALPVKSNICQLGDSSNNALKQFSYMEKRLNNNPNLRQQYSDFMSEYIELNHMEEVKNPELSNCVLDKTYYLPHHAVMRESSSTTKLRVVFNGSSKTSSALSLNDCLMVGPTIQPDLCSTILKFRKHTIGVTGDITKMYRQIEVHPDHRDLQRIWWRHSVDDPVKCYRLKTVTYGTTSAPFLAIRTLFQLANDEENDFPTASKILKQDFYVDDVLTGSDTEENAIKLKNDLIDLLSRGGFELRKFQSNNPTISSSNESTQSKSIKILGMNWDTETDLFTFSFQQYSTTESCTKRSVLSEIAQLFDPLGICAPVVFVAKSFMQTLWSSKLHWDDELPEILRDYWNDFKRQLISIDNISFPRCVTSSSPKIIELHGFGDASEKGYGCVIYIRTVDHFGNCFVKFLTSKSRVAPLKIQTIPRLELCASVLLAQLVHKVISVMDINFSSIYLWTDSEITLYRIKSIPSRYTTFVANRVSQIQDLSSPDDWYYVPTAKNPSDLASRGVMPSDFKNAEIWWSGPDFLNSSKMELPNQPELKMSLDQLELRKITIQVQSSSAEELWKPFEYFSNLRTLHRVFGYVLRFIKCTKIKVKLRKTDVEISIPVLPRSKEEIAEAVKTIPTLSTVELDDALKSMVKHIQNIEYNKDLRHLRKHNVVSPQSNLKSLSPFIDQDGILRVGGRLSNAKIPFDHKHQMLLPGSHSFSKLLVHTEHLRLLHAGPQTLLYSLRQRFWIISGRNLCRTTVKNCIMCTRTRPRNINQIMGQLPENRVNPSRPFEHVGVDFCGPFLTKNSLRSTTIIKSYVAVFICFATKAVHTEVVSDLSSDAFIASLRRFVSRRGLCSNLYSDNATNFIGSKSELQDLRKLFLSEFHQHEVLKFCVDHAIQWHTIPPRSPHFGGLWEAAVKSAKHHLKRVIGTTSYTNEHLFTLIVQVEACLNSRPIGYMSDNPNDYECLTPGHFLIGQPLTLLPDPSLSHLNFNRLSQYQKIQQTFQTFWKRWSQEYLSQLQQKKKWSKPNQNVNVGDLVMLHEDHVPPLKWPMARVIEVHRGQDGFVRVVTVKTAHSEFKRAITRISPLPIQNDFVSGDNS